MREGPWEGECRQGACRSGGTCEWECKRELVAGSVCAHVCDGHSRKWALDHPRLRIGLLAPLPSYSPPLLQNLSFFTSPHSLPFRPHASLDCMHRVSVLWCLQSDRYLALVIFAPLLFLSGLARASVVLLMLSTLNLGNS